MAAIKLATHIQPEATPANVTELVLLLAKSQQSFETVEDLLTFAESEGVGNRTEIQSTAANMGLLDKANRKISLGSGGRAFANLREEARSDVLHFLIYSGWNIHDPLEFLPSWAYRDCCDRYWEVGTVSLTSDYLDRQVQETINKAREIFEAMNVGEFSEISFSRKSLNGAHNWLTALRPPVIEKANDKKSSGNFNRRDFCPPELLMLALGYVLRDEVDAIGVDVLLTREKRALLCRVCLLEPDSLDRALDWAIPIFPNLIKPGTSAGFYGRFIRLNKLPTLADLAR